MIATSILSSVFFAMDASQCTAADISPREAGRGVAWSAEGRIGLVTRYLLASAPVVLALTIGLGAWVTDRIERQVLRNTASELALYVQSFIAVDLQGLATRDRLTEGEVARLKRVLTETPLGERLRSLKIWKEGGVIVYSSRNDIIGQRFPPSNHLRRAWQGEVNASLDDLEDREDRGEASLGIPLLEVYSPVRRVGGERVIAVTEFYQDARTLRTALSRTRWRTWLVVSVSTLLAYGVLLLIVRQGGAVIRRQREAATEQVDQLSALLNQNERLSTRLRRAARRTAAVNEEQLRRVSAELHDGPAQSLSLALLRLDTVSSARDGISAQAHAELREDVKEVQHALDSALTELRQISRGLALPELSGMTLADVLELVVSSHNKRTDSTVAVEVSGSASDMSASDPLKLTVYRFVQETLMNAHRHAHDANAFVRASVTEGSVDIQVVDEGPGFDVGGLHSATDRLGLHGLRERVEAIGGSFEIESRPDVGTHVRAYLPARGEG